MRRLGRDSREHDRQHSSITLAVSRDAAHISSLAGTLAARPGDYSRCPSNTGLSKIV